MIVALLLGRRTRHRSEIALRESEERAEIAGVSLGVGFWTWQPDNDRVWTTRQCAWLLGTEMGKRLTLDELLHALRPRIDEPVDSAFEQAVRSGTAFDGELPVERDDGSVRWIIAAIRPSADSRGRRHITGVLMDVTARKTAELLAAEQLRELTHLGRVAMLGEMSGTLSHELRQPLAAILTYAQATRRLVDQQPADLDKVRHGLDAIVKAEKHAGSVIDRIRAMLKRSDPKPEALDINEVVRETLELAALELRSRAVAPSTYLERNLPMVFGDRIQLQQVLINLVLNACDAMSEVAPPYRRMAVTTWYHEEKVQILVRDAGTGISEDRIDRIFEPFMTTKQDGLGLGLAICHSIVRAHGGDIRAVNNPDGGSTFQILLPRGTREATSGETSTKGLPKDSMRIVVVDDDEAVRMALQSLLRASGHEVRVFASAEDLLAQEVVADCFLFDVCLPKMNGIELAELIRSAGSDVPIVLMTGHDRGSFERAIRQSGLPLVSKPCDEEEILNAVASRKR